MVTNVHLALPQWARASQDRLAKYLSSLPSSAILDITAARWLWPRVTRLRVSELYIPNQPHRMGGSSAHLLPNSFNIQRRVPQVVIDNKKWYQWRPEKGFLVSATNGSDIADSTMWPQLLSAIQKGWGYQRGLAPPARKPISGGNHGRVVKEELP